jgi:sugar O-acyltransferase (sialic acid O-acetyltransferase NeuD family)
MDKNGIVMIGSGGHANACLDLIESITTYSITFKGKLSVQYTIEDTRKLSEKNWDDICDEYSNFVMGIGQIHNAKIRKEIVHKVSSRGGRFMTLISPDAHVSPNCHIGVGSIIMPNAAINRNAKIGGLCILNTGCIVEHDATVKSYTHVATGAVVNGDCEVGCECFIGSNAVMLNQIKISDEISVGAGSVVTSDLTEKGIFCGNPAKYLKPRR